MSIFYHCERVFYYILIVFKSPIPLVQNIFECILYIHTLILQQGIVTVHCHVSSSPYLVSSPSSCTRAGGKTRGKSCTLTPCSYFDSFMYTKCQSFCRLFNLRHLWKINRGQFNKQSRRGKDR